MRDIVFITLCLVLYVPNALAADVDAGKKLAAKICASCHSQRGAQYHRPQIPILSGQHKAYLVKQLRAFRDGKRYDAVHSEIAKMLSESDIDNVATYFKLQREAVCW